MGHALGLVEFPVEASLGGDHSRGDPLLWAVGGFCKAILNTKCADAYIDIGGGFADGVVVNGVAYNDPEDSTFNENDLPALFVYRDHGQKHEVEWATDDSTHETTLVRILWAPPPGPQDIRSDRAPFFNAIFKAIELAFAVGVDPCWVAEGETNAEYLTRGTPIQIAAGCYNPPRILRAHEVPIKIGMDGVAPDREYPGWFMDLQVVETTAWDLTLFGYPSDGRGSSVIQSEAHSVGLDLGPPVILSDDTVLVDGNGETLEF